MRVLCVGLVCLDIINECTTFPEEDSDQRCLHLRWQRGGNASNNCTILSKIGIDCEFLGLMSSDLELSFLSKDFLDHGICIKHCPMRKSPPGKSFLDSFPVSTVIVNSANGSRTILHSKGDFPELTLEHFEKIDISKYSWIHFEGRNVEAVSSMMKKIKSWRSGKEAEGREISTLPVPIVSVELEKPKLGLLAVAIFADVVFIGKDFAMSHGWEDKESAIEGMTKHVCKGERAYFSISQLDSNDKIVSHVSLCGFPNIPAVPPWDWLYWAKNMYRLESIDTRNTLFIHLMVWSRKYSLSFLKPLIEILFLNCPQLENLMMIVPPRATASKIFEEYFTMLTPKTSDYLENVQTLCICMRKQYFPKLRIRMAVEEDHDDLVPIINKQNSKLSSVYGDYYMSEVIAHSSEERNVLVAEDDSIAVGVMSLSKDVDVNILVEHFELKTFNGLHKPDNQDLLISKPFEALTNQQKIYGTLSKRSFLEIIYEEVSFDGEVQLEDECYVTDAKMYSSESVYPSHDYFRPRRFTSVCKELVGPSCLNLSEDSAPAFNFNNDLLLSEFEDIFSSLDTIKRTKQDIFLPTYFGKENAFCVEFLGVNEDYDERQADGFFQAAFELFPDRDFCLISLPFHYPTFPLIDYFVRCSPRCHRTFPHELFVIHRNSALSSVTVRKANFFDKTVLSLFYTMELHKEIVIDFLNAIRPEEKCTMAFIVESEGTAVGAVIIREEDDITYVRSHYNIERFQEFELIQPEEHGEIMHLALNPIFQRHSKFVIQEVLRLSGMACLYYKLYPDFLAEKVNQSNIVTALAEMMPVKPRHQILYYLNYLDIRQPENSILKIQDPYALYMMTAKLSNILTLSVNTRIVVVGASTTALSFLESLLYSSTEEFLVLHNVTLVSSYGLPDKISNNETVNMFTMNNGFYSWEYLAKLSLRTWINSVSGFMTGIDINNKRITVNYNTILNYDYLIILTGEQFQDELKPLHGDLGLHSKRKEHEIGCVNSFCINSHEDAVCILEYLKKNFNKCTSRKIIIYGYSIEAYVAVAALRNANYPGERIVLVENFPCEGHRITRFNNEEVYEGVIDAIKKEGIEILKNYHLASCEISQIKKEVTKVRFINKANFKTFDCLAFINYGKKGVDKCIFSAITNSPLVYNGRLVIKPDFSTNDPNIFSAGPLTKYAGRFYAQDYEHRYYNSREIGKKVCKEIKFIWNPKSKTIKTNSTDKLLSYTKPLITWCKLPRGWNYLNITKAGIQVPLNEAMSHSDYGKVLITGDCYSEDNGYFRIHLNPCNIIETITCYTRKSIDVENIIKLYGKHDSLFNNLTKRYEMGYVGDFYEYFRQPWVTAIYYDRFSNLLNELLNTLKKVYGHENIILTEVICNLLNKYHYKEITKDDMNILKKLFKKSFPKRKIEMKILEFIDKNKHHFPMYVHADDTRDILAECKDSQFHYLQ